MPFIGKNPTAGFATIVKDDFTADGTTTVFTLSKIATVNDIAVYVGNVRQEPTDAYTVNGTTLTMSAAPATGVNFYVLHIAGTIESSVVPPDGSIGTAKLVNNAVTSAKIAAGAVDTTELASGAVTSAKLDTNISVTGDFTADSSNSTLFVDASTNKVHVGGGTSDANTSALSVRKNGGGNFIANFENTSTTAPYGLMVRDPSGSSAGYPLFQVSNSGGNHYFRVDSNTGKNYFAPGGIEKVRIDSDGMKFNGDTAATNALDDYEEGTFTATLYGTGSGSGNNVTTTGNYVKVGKVVTIGAYFQNMDLSSMSGAVNIGGLPFTSSSVTTSINTGSVAVYGFSFSGFVTPYINNSTTTIDILDSVSGSAWAGFFIPAAAGKYLIVGITYKTS